MNALLDILTWVRANPRIFVGIVVGLMAAWGFAQRKPRVFRQADRDFDRLRGERGASYDKTRLP